MLMAVSLLLSSQNFQERIKEQERFLSLIVFLLLLRQFSRTTHRSLKGKLLQSSVKLLIYR